MGFKKRGAREMVWGPEEPWVEPKKEVILGPAGAQEDVSKTSIPGETSLGFLSTMAGVASQENQETERPKSSPYGWEPEASSSSTSSESYSDPDMTEKVFRLQRKIDNLVERIEELERKMNN